MLGSIGTLRGWGEGLSISNEVEACASSKDDQSRFKEKRDYTILCLIWDSALRQGIDGDECEGD
jgi:hypothetical protein